jgi:sialate O-acetylesterase
MQLAVALSFASSMVLQRDAPNVLWGRAAPGARVSAVLGCAGCPALSPAVAGADGTWRVALPALPATAAPFAVTVSSPSSPDVVLNDVLVGDVLLCSGQSNLALSLQMALNASAEIAALDAFGPTLRVLQVANTFTGAPLADFSALAVPWSRAAARVMNATGFAGFSATCWFAGRELWHALGAGAVPVGLIEASVGGRSIRQWTPTAGLAACPQPYSDPQPYGVDPYNHSWHWNAMVAPLTTGPTALRAVVWDQAESDSFPQTPLGFYGCQTTAQINSWRAALRAPALAWVFVVLQPYTGSGPCCLAELRSAQLGALALPRVAYASAVDLGDAASPWGNVHFRDKQTIGARLALALRAVAYDGDAAAAAAYPPPAFLSQAAYLDASNTSVVDVAFARPDGAPSPALSLDASGDAATCPPTIPSSNCTAFEILGSDGSATPAAAALSAAGDALRLTAALAPGVYPVGSAYGWGAWPLASLFAGDLPVLPWQQALTMRGPPGPPPPLWGDKKV